MRFALLADQHRPAVMAPAGLVQPLPQRGRVPGRLAAVIGGFAEYRDELADLAEVGTPERAPVETYELSSLADELPVDWAEGDPRVGVGLVIRGGARPEAMRRDSVFGLTWVDREGAGPWMVTLDELPDLADLRVELATDAGVFYGGPAIDPARDIDADIATSARAHPADRAWILVEPLPASAGSETTPGLASVTLRGATPIALRARA